MSRVDTSSLVYSARSRPVSGGLTPCQQLRPSSRREHVRASNSRPHCCDTLSFHLCLFEGARLPFRVESWPKYPLTFGGNNCRVICEHSPLMATQLSICPILVFDWWGLLGLLLRWHWYVVEGRSLGSCQSRSEGVPITFRIH